MRICVKRHKAVKGEEKGGERSRTDKRGESGSSCMPENAWQESRDTGLRHLSVGVALYAGLCSGFILLYAPAFLSLLSLFEKKEGIIRICVKRHKAVKGEEKGGERSRTDKRGDEQIREEQQA